MFEGCSAVCMDQPCNVWLCMAVVIPQYEKGEETSCIFCSSKTSNFTLSCSPCHLRKGMALPRVGMLQQNSNSRGHNTDVHGFRHGCSGSLQTHQNIFFCDVFKTPNSCINPTLLTLCKASVVMQSIHPRPVSWARSTMHFVWAASGYIGLRTSLGRRIIS